MSSDFKNLYFFDQWFLLQNQTNYQLISNLCMPKEVFLETMNANCICIFISNLRRSTFKSNKKYRDQHFCCTLHSWFLKINSLFQQFASFILYLLCSCCIIKRWPKNECISKSKASNHFKTYLCHNRLKWIQIKCQLASC